MSFLAPLLAGFTAACAIPILIHLLNKSRFRTIQWAAMDFLLKTLQQNKKRLQLRDLLLMILRTAAILFAALALARPSLSSGLGGFSGGSSATVIVLDASLSMGAQDGVHTRLEAAKERAKAASADSSRGSSCALVLLSDTATSELTEPTRDLGFITGAIERVTAADGGTRVITGLAKARELLEKSSGRKEVVLITDLQATGWSAADDPTWRRTLDDLQRSGVNLIIADVGHGPVNHVAIDRVACEDDLVTTGDTTTLLVTLRNHGAGAAHNLTVDLLVAPGAAPAQTTKDVAAAKDSTLAKTGKKVASTVVADLAPGATAQARLVWKVSAAGPHRVTIDISPDALPNDHQRYLVIDVLDRLPVLVVDGGVAAQGQWTGGDFLRAALSPKVGDDEDAHSSMAITRITPAELGTANLERYRCVVLTDLDAPSAALSDALAARVRAGMGLLLFPGVGSRRDDWQKFLGERAKLLPSAIGAPVEHPDGGGLALATDKLDHPIVSFFTDAEHRPFWAAPRFKKSFALTAPSDDQTVRVVARFADGSPWCLERTVGAGSVLLFATPLDRSWSDFPLRPAFVMAITRAVQHAALGWTSRLAHLTNEALSVEVPARFGKARIQVSQPDGTQTLVTPVPGPNNTLRADVASTGRSGFYRLWAEGAGAASTELGLFAVNPPAEESDLTPLTREQAQGRLGTLTAAYVGADEDAEKGLRSSRAGIELWPWLLGLAIACLLMEMFLGQHWAPRDSGAHSTKLKKSSSVKPAKSDNNEVAA